MIAFGSTSIFLLLSIGNQMLTARENRDVIFCESADLHMDCPMNTEIIVKSVTNENAKCKQNGENEECLQQFDELIKSECSMKNNCTLSADEFDKQGCSRIPKRIKAHYTCTCLWVRKIPKNNKLCTKDLQNINCDGLCYTFATKLVINNIQENEAFCQECSNIEVKEDVGILCKDRFKCSVPQNNDNCLFHPRFVKIEYSCQGENMLTSLPSNTSAINTEFTATQNANTSFTYVTPETAVYSTDGTTIINETPPKIRLDMQGRVLIFNPVENKSFAVCGDQWDENDAKVLCNHLDENSYGFAYQLQANEDMNLIFQLEFQCTGNETNLFKCTTKFDGYGCKISTIAAAKCCKAGTDLSECSKDTSSMKASTTSNTGLIIGLVLGFLLLACVVILIILFLRRFIGPKKKYQEQTSAGSRNDYVGTQGVAIPVANEHRPPYPGLEMEIRDDQYHDISDLNNASNKNISDPNKYAKLNNKNKHFSGQKIRNNSGIPDQSNKTVIISNSHSTVNNYVVLDPNETGFNRSEGPDKMNESYELAQLIHHIDHTKDTELERKTLNDVYAHSVEGEYDSSNGNRHKQSESDVYSRTFDNVYDSSNHTRKNGEAEDNYDHFTGKKTDDDYDISHI